MAAANRATFIGSSTEKDMKQQFSEDKKRVFEIYGRHVSSKKARFFLDVGIDFVFGRREGPFVWDIDGKQRLINCHSNGGVFNLGHRHPAILETLEAALKNLDIGNHHLVSREKAELAEQLAGLCPGDLDYVVFGVSGGEAIDTAIKIARKATGRRGVISAMGAYHGHTGLALAAGDPKFRDPFLSSSSDFKQVPFNDVLALAREMDADAAAVILETIPATLGMPIAGDDYFKEVALLCRKNGTLLIIDEVQTGLGRTGRFWGIEHYHTVPDIIVAAKGLSGGLYPLSVTIIRRDLEAVFHEDPFIHISTAGGADIGCVVARKVLEISSGKSFLDHVDAIANLFDQGMARLMRKYSPLLTAFRHKGLMCGIKTSRPDFGPILSKTCYDAGLLCIYAAHDPSVLQFLPALIIDRDLADEILQRLDRAFESAAAFIGE